MDGFEKARCPREMIRLIRSFHQDIGVAGIHLDGQVLEDIHAQNGLRQGCGIYGTKFSSTNLPGSRKVAD